MTDLTKGRILVTGGAGFIGSAIVWALNRRGCENILISDFLRESDKWKNLAPLKYADYLEADDLETLILNQPQQLADVRTIFHLGAHSSTTEMDAAYLVRNNYEYTKALAHFALEGGRRFLYASSAATYGAREIGLREDLRLSSLRPLNMYGYSKQMFDCYAQRAGILETMTGLKYFNVFGPNEAHKSDMSSLVYKAFHQIEEAGQVRLFKSYRPEYPDGGQKRDFVYVKDAVDATLWLAENVTGGGLFNVGSGRATTWLTLVDALYTALERKPKVEFIEMPVSMRSKYQYYTCADLAKLRSAGYQNGQTSLTAAVQDYVRNYLVPGKYLGDEGTTN
jgi:ADP-L-glycero-D-manno-heptose 6-epimerase